MSTPPLFAAGPIELVIREASEKTFRKSQPPSEAKLVKVTEPASPPGHFIAYSCFYCAGDTCTPSEQATLDAYLNSLGTYGSDYKTYFASQCPASPSSAYKNCSDPVEGVCENFEVLQVLDVVAAPSSSNPLP